MKLTRTLHLTNPMMKGNDVKSVQTLLTGKGFPVIADGVFGSQTGMACVDAKTRLNYPKAKRVPTCGQFLVDALEKHAPFPPLPISSPRQRYVDTLRTFYGQRSNWDYSQTRPLPHPGHTGRVVTDCSGGVTYAAETAKCPDPNGRGYDGYGFTGTLLDHCRRISMSSARPGDLIVYGPYPGHHVVAIIEASADPLCWSHGHQGDPEMVPHSAQLRYEPAGVTVLSFLP